MMNMIKFFGVLLLCSIFTLNAEPTVEKTELTAKQKKELGKRLIYAAENGSCDDVKECLDAGADVNFRGKRYNETALLWAAFKGKPDMVKLLVERGADVNAQNIEGDTALILVAHEYKIEDHICLQIMEFLLNKGIKVNQKNKDGQTALFWAALHGRKRVCKFLLQFGASVNIADKDGEYPFDVVYHEKKKLKQKLHPTGLYRLLHWLRN